MRGSQKYFPNVAAVGQHPGNIRSGSGCHLDAVGVLDDGLVVLVSGRDGHGLLARRVAHALLNLDVVARLRG